MTPGQYAGLLTALGNSPGFILMWGAAAPPAGWLLCDGSAVSRTTYAALFAVIGITFGAGDGSTTFNVPDMRSRSPIGVGQGAGLSPYTLAQKVGAETVTLAAANVPALDVAVDTAPPMVGGTAAVQGSSASATPGTVAGAVNAATNNSPFSIVHPVLGINVIIKY